MGHRRNGIVGRALAGLTLSVGLVVFSVLSMGSAQASVFTVTDISIEATADNAAVARELAHKRGRRTAYKKVVKRLTNPSDWLLIPELSDTELLRMDRGLKIRDERNSRKRYLATVDVSFDPDKLREVLRTAGIAFSDSQARKAVVIPVLEMNGQRVLWDGANPWLRAWTKRRLVHELTPVVAPLGDLNDISAVDADRAVQAHWPDLSTFAARYGDTDVLVAYAVLGGTDAGYGPDIMVNPFGDPSGAETPLALPTSGNGNLKVTIWRVNAQGRKGGTITVSGPMAAAQKGETVFDQGVDKVIGALSRVWRDQTIVDYSQSYELNATVRLASLNDWVDTQKALDGIAMVNRWTAPAVSATGAELSVIFSGSVDQLALNLTQRGFALSGQHGYWTIGRRGYETARLEDLYGLRPPVFRVRSYGQEATQPGADQGQSTSGSRVYTPGPYDEPLMRNRPLSEDGTASPRRY